MGSGGHGRVLAEQRGGIGFLTLDRPSSLNALSLEMIRALASALESWRSDPEVRAVVVQGRHGTHRRRTFCAGGDIRALHSAVLAGGGVGDFFDAEFSLVHAIHTYPKPYLALMDGLTLGGGMGISQGASLRILTEHSRLGMPETRIGLFPDVGAGLFLGRTPGAFGEFLGLTGHIVGPGDALALGLGDVYLPSVRIPELLERLPGHPDPETLARAMADEAPAAPLMALRETLDRHFSRPDMPAILGSLASEDSDFLREIQEALERSSPTMLCVTLEHLRKARGMGLAELLREERILMHHGFDPQEGEALEGIRARVIDKDDAPGWKPTTLAEVDRERVEAFFSSPWTASGHPLAGLV
nr:enoyl-CoA hydratase/isomerase family protein [uncultured Holophaga sp.]